VSSRGKRRKEQTSVIVRKDFRGRGIGPGFGEKGGRKLVLFIGGGICSIGDSNIMRGGMLLKKGGEWGEYPP